MMKKSTDSSLDRSIVEQISTAIKVGYRHLDGAELYNTEAELGAAMKESKIPRNEFFLTTKVNANMDDIPGTIDTSLKKLQTDHVDLFLIHQPYFAEGNAAKLQKAWAAMEAVLASGKAKSIGVSNYRQEELEATLQTAKVVPSVNQVEFHPYLQREGLLPFQKEKGIALAAFGPLTPVTRAKPGPLDPLLASLAKKYAVNEGEILLRWIMDQGVVVVTTSSKEQRLSDMLRVCTFSMTPKEVADISKTGLEKSHRAFWGAKYAEGDYR